MIIRLIMITGDASSGKGGRDYRRYTGYYYDFTSYHYKEFKDYYYSGTREPSSVKVVGRAD